MFQQNVKQQNNLYLSSQLGPPDTLIIDSQIKNLAYLCNIKYDDAQEKLNIIAINQNGQPFKLPAMLSNQVWISSLKQLQLNPRTQGISINRNHDDFLEFTLKWNQNRNIQMLNGSENFKYLSTMPHITKNLSSFTQQIFDNFLMNILKGTKYVKVKTSSFSQRIKTLKSSKKAKLNLLKAVRKQLRKYINQINPKNIQKNSHENDEDWQNMFLQSSNSSSSGLQNPDNQIQNISKTGNIFQLRKISIVQDQKWRRLGGVSLVSKVKVSRMQYLNSGIQIINNQQKFLIQKSMRKFTQNSIFSGIDTNQKIQNTKNRFLQQLKMISHINKIGGRKQYLLDYYQEKPSDQISCKALPEIDQIKDDVESYYANFVELNLQQFLKKYHKILDYADRLDICLQMVKIIMDLHRCGVIHRDLKPDNILVIKQQNLNKIKLKLIDFSDSNLIEKQVEMEQSKLLHGSLPFSPIQCEKHNNQYKRLGLNKKQIDYWSVGMVIHIIIYGYHPISFSNCYYKQINKLWQKQILILCDSQYNSVGIDVLKKIFQILKISLLRGVQKQRMNLKYCYSILSACRNYLDEIFSM